MGNVGLRWPAAVIWIGLTPERDQTCRPTETPGMQGAKMSDQASRGWYYKHDERTAGPTSAGELKKLAASGQLQPSDLVRKEGVSQWVPAARVRGLFATAGAEPPIGGKTE